MSVKRLPNGKWRCTFRYKDVFGKVRQKKKETFKTKRQAQAWENEYIALHDGKANPNMTFRQLTEIYLQDIQKRRKATTYNTYTNLCKKANQYIGDMQVDDITVRTIRELQNQLLDNQIYSAETKKLINRQVAQVMNYGVRFLGLANNPCKDMRFECPQQDKQEEKVKFWTQKQFEQFLSRIPNDNNYGYDERVWKLFYSLLFYGGLRRGEAAALTVADIDFLNNSIHINKNKNQYELGTPKTINSRRIVIMPKAIMKKLKVMVQKMYQAKPNTELFPFSPMGAYEHWQIRLKKYGQDLPQISVHDLRHSHASMLIDLGFSLQIIADRLGHKDTNMVSRVYGHLYRERKQEVADKLDTLMEE